MRIAIGSRTSFGRKLQATNREGAARSASSLPAYYVSRSESNTVKTVIPVRLL